MLLLNSRRARAVVAVKSKYFEFAHDFVETEEIAGIVVVVVAAAAENSSFVVVWKLGCRNP